MSYARLTDNAPIRPWISSVFIVAFSPKVNNIKIQNIILDFTYIFYPIIQNSLSHPAVKASLHSWMGNVQSIVLYGLRIPTGVRPYHILQSKHPTQLNGQCSVPSKKNVWFCVRFWFIGIGKFRKSTLLVDLRCAGGFSLTAAPSRNFGVSLKLFLNFAKFLPVFLKFYLNSRFWLFNSKLLFQLRGAC